MSASASSSRASSVVGTASQGEASTHDDDGAVDTRDITPRIRDPARPVHRYCRVAAGTRRTTRRHHRGAPRVVRPGVPIVVQRDVQLRAAIRSPGWLHLVGPVRAAAAVRSHGLRPVRPRSRRRRHHLLRRRPQGDGSLRHVGVAERGRPDRGARAAAGERAQAAAAGGSAGIPPQSGDRHTALPGASRQAAGRASHTRHAVREAVHRCVGRGRAGIARPGVGGRGPVRRERAAGAHH